MEYKSIPSEIWVNTFLIRYSYETKRKNKKEQIRKIKQIDESKAKIDFWHWLESMAEKEPHRAMFNVNILSIEKVNGEFIKL